MPESKPLAEPYDIIYLYDGSLAGFYCCVHESVYQRQIPCAITPVEQAQPNLLPQKQIMTDRVKSLKVRRSIPAKISPSALDLVELVFLSCLEEKELSILRFLLLAYRQGAKTMQMLGHPEVERLLKAERHMRRESQHLLGFVRFSDYNGVLAASISPKNFVLPLIAGHFVRRFSEEDFMIYDKTHKAALVYENRRQEIIFLENMTFPEVSESEQRYRHLWKQFYNAIAIENRNNPKCRMNLMPKRYWENMLEVQELL